MRGRKYDNQMKKSGDRFNKLDMAIEKVSDGEDAWEENRQNKAWSDKNRDDIESKSYQGYG